MMRVNGVFRLKGELEFSASMMVLVCLLRTHASGVVDSHTRRKNRKAKCVYDNKAAHLSCERVRACDGM